MDKIQADLRISEERQSSLCRAYESLHAEANSVVLFSLQWKELEEHFESTRSEIRTRLQELENREKEMDDLGKRLEASELRFDSEMAAKALELRGIEKSIAEKVKEYESGKLRLKSVDLSIDVKKRQVSEVESLVREKERERDSIDRCIEERNKILNWFVKNAEERSVEIEAKEKEVEEVRTVLSKYGDDIELKERRLNSIMESIEERTKVYDLKEEEIRRAERSIEECDKKTKLRKEKLSLIEISIKGCEEEMKSKKEKLSLIRKSLAECSNTLESRENAIRELELKERDFCLLKKPMEEWSCKLEYKERELCGWLEKLELKEKGFEQKLEELHLIDRRVNDIFDDVQLKEKHLDSLQQMILEHEKRLDSLSNGLQVKERKLELQARTLEFRQRKFDSIRKSAEERSKKMALEKKTNILNSQVKIEQLEHNPANNPSVPLPAIIQSSINMSSKDLQLFLNEHLKRHDLLGTEISGILQASSDPAKLVLDAMQGFYPSSLVVENKECDFDVSVIRRSCILLLQELKRVSPQINPPVREEARKLAGDWKDKMTVAVENGLEVLGFLLLITTFDLTSTYPESELQSLLLVAGQQAHVAQATGLSLGISDKAPECSITSVKIVEPESSLAKSEATLSSPYFQPSATIDARTLQGILIEHMKQNHSMQKEMLAALQMSSDPAKLVLDVIQTSFARYWSRGEVALEETFMLSMIDLLEELMRVSPNVGPHVKEDAIKLAYTWEAKMKGNTENSSESLGYLQFLATYRLLYRLNEDEIKKILGMIYQHKQALKICQTLGFVPEFVKKLIERKQLLEAARLICTFKIAEKFPPVRLLKEYVEGARKSCRKMWRKKKSLDEKEEVVDHLIADLRAVTQCFQDYNLESDYPSKGIDMLIVELEKMKENWRRCEQSLVSKVEQEVNEPSPASNVGQEGEKEDQSPCPKVGQEERKASPSSRVGQKEKKSPPSSKVGEEETKPSPATEVRKEVNKVKKLVKKVKKPSLASKVGPDDKAEKKPSLASTVEQEEKTEKNPSHASTVEQEEKTENPPLASAVEQESKTEKKPSASKVEQEEKSEKKSLASNVQQEEKNEKKRSASASDSTFQRQQRQSKRPRIHVPAATPYRMSTVPPAYMYMFWPNPPTYGYY
ncbi:putative leucine-rich repeat-containing protein DDB_G0290503 [Pyrus x bretschneideri]|uniref:putative leucine-rich repeat-containing protein DDB_G0290503 n=1 Tax=Pyrus x bretschneideri TaxID=225117 RepID=UPI002030E795|nr:putative leucine-rich repeat-containing protein DDB_G0290503 [Pyrus x bretschneideri]